LAEASLHGDSRATSALGTFYRRYQAPVKSFMAWRGVAEDALEDMVQEFFLHAMQRSLLKRADRQRGRFRSFLCGAVVLFLKNVNDWASAKKRGGDIDLIAYEDGNAAIEDDQRAFDRGWALRMLELAFERVQAEYDPVRFAVLKEFLPGSLRPPTTAEAAHRLDLTDNTLLSEVHRLRKRYRECLRAEVAVTTSAPHEVDAELAWLRQVLANG
jgi:DNA-directed RNA polymerase specialized sigma24 family protein